MVGFCLPGVLVEAKPGQIRIRKFVIYSYITRREEGCQQSLKQNFLQHENS